MINKIINKIIDNQDYTITDLVTLLEAEGDDLKKLYKASQVIKEKHVKKITYFRGLVEFF
jgi:hypothetical protein